MAGGHSRILTFRVLPARMWVQRFSFGFFTVLALSLLMMSKAGNPSVERMKSNINDVMVPVLEVIASPMDAATGMVNWVGTLTSIYEQNVALKNQNIQLLQWQAKARQLELENASLKNLLQVVPAPRENYVTVRVVSDLGGPFGHAALINGGAEDGVKKDQAVVTQEGLVGRVIEVGDISARVLLLSDINSRVPVMSEESGEKSILAGNNSALPTLAYLPTNSKLRLGDRLVTSGDGGIFPAGVPVGVVVSSDRGVMQVQPFVDPASVTFASIIDYSL